MNPDCIDRNTTASKNGNFCEEYARRMLPGVEWLNGLYDARFGGKPLEIKSCEAWYKRSYRPSASRKAGMVTLYKEQDTELKKTNGNYFCIVHIGELIVKSFFVPARKVPAKKQISWTTLQKLVEVA